MSKSVWKRHGDFEVALREFPPDFRAYVADVERAYKLGHRDVVYVEVRPYGDFVEWAKAQEPDWDRYARDGTKVLIEQGRLPKSADYDSPDLERAGVSVDEWYRLGFEHYVDSIAKAIRAGKNVPRLYLSKTTNRSMAGIEHLQRLNLDFARHQSSTCTVSRKCGRRRQPRSLTARLPERLLRGSRDV